VGARGEGDRTRKSGECECLGALETKVVVRMSERARVGGWQTSRARWLVVICMFQNFVMSVRAPALKPEMPVFSSAAVNAITYTSNPYHTSTHQLLHHILLHPCWLAALTDSTTCLFLRLLPSHYSSQDSMLNTAMPTDHLPPTPLILRFISCIDQEANSMRWSSSNYSLIAKGRSSG